MQVLRLVRKSFDPATARADVVRAFDGVARMSLHLANEATTRVVLIDKILCSLGWGQESVGREVPSGVGTYLDYELHLNDVPWAVVEAKRAGETFSLSGTMLPDDGIVSVSLLSRRSSELRAALRQAADYCNARAIPIAAVTNGSEWVLFRGLSAPKRPWLDGVALVFAGRDHLVERFDEFSDALSKSGAGTGRLFRLLDRRAPAAVPVSVVPKDLIRIQRPSADAAKSVGIREASDFLLGDIYGEQRSVMLQHCYVEPGTLGDFERSIQRLLQDTAQPLDTSEEHYFDGGTKEFVDEVARRDEEIRHPVVVVGHVGAGKSTFLHRALARFRDDRSAFCANVDLEGYSQSGTFDARREEEKVAEVIIDKLRNSATTVLKHKSDLPVAELELGDINSPKTMKQLCSREIRQEKALGADYWSANPDAWAKKEYEILSEARKDRIELLWRYVRHLSNRFRRDKDSRYPVLVALDNLDQASDEYQKLVYGFCQRLARETSAIPVVCLREDTFSRGREPGGFLTSSPLPFIFHVAAPAHDRVLRQRTKYGEYLLEKGETPKRLSREALAAFCAFARTVFLTPRSESLELLACLSGNNIRETLALSRAVAIGSTTVRSTPHPGAAYSLECLISGGAPEAVRARQLLYNCLDAEPDAPPAHLLRTRLLAYLAWVSSAGGDRPLLEAHETIEGRFSALGYSVASITSALSSLLVGGMLKPFAESERGRASTFHVLPSRLTITAAGHAHLTRLLSLPAYRASVAMSTRWYDPALAHDFVRRAQAAGGEDGPTIDDVVASQAAALFDAYIAQSEALENATLSTAMMSQSWVRETLARSKWGHVHRVAELTPAPDSRVPVDRLTRDTEYKGSAAIARILWSLRWAEERGRSAISPSEIVEILRDAAGVETSQSAIKKTLKTVKRDGRANGLWRVAGGRLSITPVGKATLQAVMSLSS